MRVPREQRDHIVGSIAAQQLYTPGCHGSLSEGQSSPCGAPGLNGYPRAWGCVLHGLVLDALLTQDVIFRRRLVGGEQQQRSGFRRRCLLCRKARRLPGEGKAWSSRTHLCLVFKLFVHGPRSLLEKVDIPALHDLTLLFPGTPHGSIPGQQKQGGERWVGGLRVTRRAKGHD